ncbi:Hypothetical protein A7982_07190 [Minicystis rosea]|nr:Hypothetical protein A7982_07190 [Minicystis rosea]
MMRAGLIVLLSFALGGCRGCERRPDSASPAEHSLADTDGPDAGRRIVSLRPEDLEGVFPPRWGVGDEWFVRVSITIPESVRGPYRTTSIHRFQVVEAPRPGADYYLLSAHGDARHWGTHYGFAVRVPDFTLTEVLLNADLTPSHQSPRFSPVPCPFADGSTPLFLFPSVPPFRAESPPAFESVLSCPAPAYDEDSPHLMMRQTIEPTAEGLHIRIESPGLFARRYVDMLWRRGDPWWSSVRIMVKRADFFDGGVHGPEVPLDFADLLRPGEEPPPLPSWWKPGLERSDLPAPVQ